MFPQPSPEALVRMDMGCRPSAEELQEQQARVEPPDLFKIVSWNVWFERLEEDLRRDQLLTEALATCPAALCLQEVTHYFHDTMAAHPAIKGQYRCVVPPLGSYDVAIWLRNDVDLNETHIIEIPSVFGRRCIAVDVQWHGYHIRVATVHLESVRENSGLRAEQLRIILPSLPELPCSEARDLVTLCGDFNLCATWEEENRPIAHNPGVCDLWDALRPSEDGWTEDSELNRMMFNHKQSRKQVRFDRVLMLRGTDCRFVPSEIERLGMVPISAKDELWASDHFGLVAGFRVSYY